MHRLRDVQACVMDALVGRSDGREATALLRTNRLPPAHRRLQVYRNNVFAVAQSALGAVYPVVARLVGEDFFRMAAGAYLRLHPSRSGDLHQFGGQLPDFLRDYAPAAGLPYLADVAWLEWAYHHAYHEAQRPAFERSRLAQVPPAEQGRLRFNLQPSASVVSSAYPILKIWQANQPGATGIDSTIRLDEGGADLLVIQNDLEIEFRILGAAERCWLDRLAAGGSLAEASGAALDQDPSFDLAAALARHLGDGLFVDFSLPLHLNERGFQ